MFGGVVGLESIMIFIGVHHRWVFGVAVNYVFLKWSEVTRNFFVRVKNIYLIHHAVERALENIQMLKT